MTTVMAYPWCLAAEGLDDACETLVSAGVDTVSLATHYHSVQTFFPRATDRPFERFTGGCYFTPDSDAFPDHGIDPNVNQVPELDDPLAAVIDAAREYGISVNGWTVCLHNSEIGRERPDCRIRGPFGTSHVHGLCPSNSMVKTYLEGVVRTISRYGVNRIDLESVGFPTVLHGHGDQFGHEKSFGISDAVERMLLSQCFCQACQSSAASQGLDLLDARAAVRDILEETMTNAKPTLPPLENLRDEYPILDSMFLFRHAEVDRLLERLAKSSGTTPINYYVADGMGRGASDGIPAGVDTTMASDHLDRVTAMCYTGDPQMARERVNRIQDRVSVPVDAAITLDPEIISSFEEANRVVKAIRTTNPNDVYVYNYNLLTREHLRWVNNLF